MDEKTVHASKKKLIDEDDDINRMATQYVQGVFHMNAAIKSVVNDITGGLSGIETVMKSRLNRDFKKTTASTYTTPHQNSKKASNGVFISYRRKEGRHLAKSLRMGLQMYNLEVFLDTDNLDGGKFPHKLIRAIQNASHFILVLTPNALDRCFNDINLKDWVHLEIVTALQSRSNIIPVLDECELPNRNELPEDIREFCDFNALKWIHESSDYCIHKLMQEYIIPANACSSQ